MIRLRTINDVLRRFGFVIVVGSEVDDTGFEWTTFHIARAGKHPLVD